MEEPDWRKLSIDAKLGHLHELLHALIEQVNNVNAKLAHLQQASRPRAVDAAGEPNQGKEAPGTPLPDPLETHGEAPRRSGNKK